MPTERIYIIGVGAISGTHIQAVRRLPQSNTIEVHVSDISPEALTRTQEQFPHVQVHDDTTAMLAQPTHPEDIVIVSVPPVAHCQMTLQALESGRHVLCEKPFAMHQDEAQQMLQKAHEVDRLLGCCSVRFIGHPATETLRAWLDAGQLGTLYNVNWHMQGQNSRSGVAIQPQAAWRVDKSRSGGGVMMDWGSYDITTLNHVLKPTRVEVLHAWMAPPATDAQLPEGAVLDVEYHVGASMRYHCENGAVVPVSFERGHPAYGEPCNRFEFQGTEGAAELNWGDGQLKRYFDQNGTVASEDVPCPPAANAPSMLERPLCFFYDAVNGTPSVSILDEQAVFNFGCLRAVYDCAETGQPRTVIKGNAQ